MTPAELFNDLLFDRNVLSEFAIEERSWINASHKVVIGIDREFIRADIRAICCA